MEVVATAPTGLSHHLKRKVSEMGDSLLGGTRTLFGWVDLNAGYRIYSSPKAVLNLFQ